MAVGEWTGVCVPIARQLHRQGDQETGDPLDGPPFTVAGNRITGNMLLLQDLPEGEGTVEVGFDLEIPSDLAGC